MRVTKWGEYGILCAIHLGKSDAAAPVGAEDIAKAHQIPLHYTQQILQRLRKGGVIESVRGPGGGYRLARDPEHISLKQILYAAEGDTFEVTCEQNSIFPDCSSNNRHCDLQLVWHELKATIDQFLESKALSDLLTDSSEDTLIQLRSQEAQS